MPPQFNLFDIPTAPQGRIPIADASPLDDILADEIPAPPVVAQAQPRIPSEVISLVPDVPPPPGVGLPKPQAIEQEPFAIPEPPKRSSRLALVGAEYEIPEPPPLPADLAPDFTGIDYERSLDLVESTPSVDAVGAADRARAAERNLATFTEALGDAQGDAVTAAQRQEELTRQASTLDQQIAALKGIKNPTAEQKAALSQMTEQRSALDGEAKAASQAVQDALGRFTTAREQQAIAKQTADQARDRAQTDLATAELEAERRGMAAQEAGAALFAKESQRIEQDAKAQTAKIEAEETAARARMDEDRKIYREALKTGPGKTNMVTTVASVIAEALAARHTRRAPDFSRVIGQLEQATKAEFDERVQRQLSLIAESEDSLSKAAQQKRVIDGQKAAQRAEVLATIEMDIQSKMAGARGTAREAQLAMVASDVRSAREAAEKTAMLELQKANAAAEKARLDRELQEAQIRKANAEASEKEGEAARKAGGGGVAKVEPVAWSAREPSKVYIPYLDTELASFEGQPNAEKRAEKAGAMVTDSFRYLQTLQEYEAMLEDYGSKKLMDKSGWTESAEYRELATQHAQLKNALAKVIAGQGFSTTESDNKAAEAMVPLPSAWNDQSRVAVARMRKNGENQLRLTLSQSLDTKAQERLIKEARRWGTSKTDLRKKAVTEAPEILTDSSKPVDARLEAINTLSERVRQDIQGDGEQAQRDAILAEIQVLKNATTEILEREYDPEEPETGVTDDAYTVVEAIKRRQRDLEKVYRKIGTDNANKREGARKEDAARSGDFYLRAKL